MNYKSKFHSKIREGCVFCVYVCGKGEVGDSDWKLKG